MGLSDIFGNVYAKFEDVFYSFLDFLDEKGLPVYGIVDPLEERGIPALPLALAVVLIAGFFAYSFLFVNTAEIEVGLDIANADGTVHLNGVQLSAGTEDGKELEL
ncbi:MAG: hypothetical protein HYW50_04105, partial [Candidatus Diapherotrites archaeon]|nr:hypothetical protein [Candidatus Diapherotrites archaeon]